MAYFSSILHGSFRCWGKMAQIRELLHLQQLPSCCGRFTQMVTRIAHMELINNGKDRQTDRETDRQRERERKWRKKMIKTKRRRKKKRKKKEKEKRILKIHSANQNSFRSWFCLRHFQSDNSKLKQQHPPYRFYHVLVLSIFCAFFIWSFVNKNDRVLTLVLAFHSRCCLRRCPAIEWRHDVVTWI